MSAAMDACLEVFAEYLKQGRRLPTLKEMVEECYLDNAGGGYKKAYEAALHIAQQAEVYDGMLQLSAGHTLWRVENDNPAVTDRIFWSAYEDNVDIALRTFKEETGVEAYLCGRSGRHVCVELNAHNLWNYDKLKEVQEELEEWVIKDLNTYFKNYKKRLQVVMCCECGCNEFIPTKDDNLFACAECDKQQLVEEMEWRKREYATI